MKHPLSRRVHPFSPVLPAGLFTAAAMVPLHARILAYEGFDCIPDAPLVGRAGGQGWAVSGAETEAVQTAWPATVPASAGTAPQPARLLRVKVQF